MRYSVCRLFLVVLLILTVTARVEADRLAPDDTSATPHALDLATLKSRLRTTPALSLTEKLTLKREVEHLLEQVRLYHRGQSAFPLEILHKQFDQLIEGLVAELQVGDPALCHDILQAQERLWSVLQNPVQFAKL